MEPNTQPNVEIKMEPATAPIEPRKNKKILILIAIIIVAIIIVLLMKSKVVAPVKTSTTSISGQAEQIVKDIDEATTFDNEADLKAIDKEF